MRLLIIILTFLISGNCYAQTWTFHKDKKSKWKYQYWFSLYDTSESTIHNFDNSSELVKSFVSATDRRGDTLDYSTIIIKRSGNEKPVYVGMNPREIPRLEAGSYSISVSAANYLPFSQTLDIATNGFFSLSVRLSKISDYTIYEIQSIEKLKDGEIRSIIECVRQGKSYECRDSERYHVAIQI